MATQMAWVRITRADIVNGREFHQGAVLEVTAEEFRALVRKRSAVPTGPGGRMLTADHRGVAMTIRKG